MSEDATVSRTTRAEETGQTIDLAMLRASGSPEAEAFRSLRANIKFAGGDAVARVILLADTGAGDARPSIAANLAVALAQSGDRTMLVDTDLRQPSLHRLFGVGNDQGVANFLQGEAQLAPQQTAVPNLLLLPAGPPPPDPADLLASGRLPLLLEQAREVAAFTVVDAPPVTTVADALAVAAVADGVLLIVRAGRTRRAAAQRAKDQLERVGAKLLGVVLTNAKPERGTSRFSW